MGVHSSKLQSQGNNQTKVEDLVDLGSVFPNGLYQTTEPDYDTRIIKNLILARKIAPFYKGLPDAPETVTLSSPTLENIYIDKRECYDPYIERKKLIIEKLKEKEKSLYNDAVECPICFLYYPTNINYSRCCDQPICTECFIQIHRPTETPTPATCPFCMEENYGVLYDIPSWSEKYQNRSRNRSHSTGTRHTTSGLGELDGPRRKSVCHKNPDVVLVDHIRPNWNKIKQVHPPNSIRPLSSRRNSLSSSRSRYLLRNTLLNRPGRSASSASSTERNQFLSNLRDTNMDIEEWMLMETIQLSLAEQEEAERKEALKKAIHNLDLTHSSISSQSNSNSSTDELYN